MFVQSQTRQCHACDASEILHETDISLIEITRTN